MTIEDEALALRQVSIRTSATRLTPRQVIFHVHGESDRIQPSRYTRRFAHPPDANIRE
jgi:hypothetical protein